MYKVEPRSHQKVSHPTPSWLHKRGIIHPQYAYKRRNVFSIGKTHLTRVSDLMKSEKEEKNNEEGSEEKRRKKNHILELLQAHTSELLNETRVTSYFLVDISLKGFVGLSFGWYLFKVLEVFIELIP